MSSGGMDSGGALLGGSTMVESPTDFVYRACRWNADPETTVLSAWNATACECTRVRLERRDDCPPYGEWKGEYCATAHRSNEPRDCENRLTPFTESEEFRVAGDVVLEPGAATIAGSVTLLSTHGDWPVPIAELEFSDCRIDCTSDCMSPGRPRPEVPTVWLWETCSGFEIEVFTPPGFYIGALDWVLSVGDYRSWPHRYDYAPGDDPFETLVYLLTPDEFDALDDGAPIYLQYGVPEEPPTEGEPFAVLDRASVERR